jgi:16S rRNA (guanine1207-N2)-methyltransferase
MSPDLPDSEKSDNLNTMADEPLQINGEALCVHRPGRHTRGLRGWDAADELLLMQGLEHLQDRQNLRILIVDDQFGALSLGLSKFSPTMLADSATLAAALRLNHSLNDHLSDDTAMAFDAPLSWLEPPRGKFDLVVLRIPRQTDYLAWLLRWANQVLDPAGLIIAGGMIKHLPDRSSEVFGDLVDTQTVTRARKKARVIISRPGEKTLQSWSEQWQGYGLPEASLEIDALPAVFSRRKLDIGTRELLPVVRQHAAGLAPGSRVLDLACGNGVLGLAALAQREDLEITFSDVSSQAVLSARHNVGRAFPGSKSHFCHCDGLPATETGFDLILLNPPFHEGGVVGDHIALTLFEQSAAMLAPAGRLLLVGNRHLGYHRTLKTSFSRVRQLVSTPKFVVLEAAHQASGRV